MGAAQLLGWRAIRGMFFSRLEEVERALWIPRIAHDWTSDQASETYRSMGHVGPMTEWKGTREKQEPPVYEMTIRNREFDNGVDFAKKDVRRDKTGQIQARIGELATSAAVLPTTILTELLEDNGNAYDGTAFFADRSAIVTGGNFVNDRTASTDATVLNVTAPTEPTSEEMKRAILLGVKTLMKALTDKGQPLNAYGKRFLVMVPTQLSDACAAALRVDLTSAGTSNSLPVIMAAKGLSIDFEINPHLTNDSRFYVFREDADTLPMVFQNEVPTEFTALAEGSEFAQKHHQFWYGAYRSCAGGYGEPGRAVRLTFS